MSERLSEIINRQEQLQQSQQLLLDSVDQSSAFEWAQVKLLDPISVTKREGDLPAFVISLGIVDRGHVFIILPCCITCTKFGLI